MHHSLNGVIENAAYIAIGADHAFKEYGDSIKWEGDTYWDGHIGYVLECLAHAEMLEEMFQRRFSDGGCAGVFAYEVAEEFGIHYGGALLRGETIDAKALAEKLADEMEGK